MLSSQRVNGSVNSSTGKTPHYIVVGEEKCIPYDILVGPRVPMYSADDYVKSHIRTFQLIHAFVCEINFKLHARN